MRLIDADALPRHGQRGGLVHWKDIEDAPTIDIVRCKECKWADWYKTADGEQFCYCMETGSGGRTADDYCSYAERSEE